MLRIYSVVSVFWFASVICTCFFVLREFVVLDSQRHCEYPDDDLCSLNNHYAAGMMMMMETIMVVIMLMMRNNDHEHCDGDKDHNDGDDGDIDGDEQQ